MSSKKSKWLFAIAGLLSVGIFGSCSLRQTPPANQELSIDNSELSCMDQLSQISDNYMKGEASDADVNSVWDCASKALTIFTQRVVGKTPGQYAATELRGFLQTYYIHKITLTNSLLESAGILKTLIVGGTPDEVSLVEIQKLQQTFETMRTITLSLRPFMPISLNGIQGKAWKDVQGADLDALGKVLDQSAIELGQVFDLVGNPYSFAQFDQLMVAIEGALPHGQDLGTLSDLELVRQRLPLIAHLKQTLINPDLTAISSGTDWKALWSTSTRWLSLALKAAWYIDSERYHLSANSNPLFPDEPLTQGSNLLFLQSMFNEFQHLMNSSVTRHAHSLITFSEINSLVDQFKDSDFSISKASIEATIPPLIQRLIAGVDFGPDGRMAQGMTPGVLAHLNKLFSDWYEGQHVLEALYQRVANTSENNTPDILQSAILTSSAAKAFWTEVLTKARPEWNDDSVKAAERLQFLISDVQPIFFLASPFEITFSIDSARQAFSFHDLATKNWMQLAAIMLVRGYVEYDPGEDHSKPPKRSAWESSPGVSLAEFTTFFQDVFSIGVQLKIFDPDYPDAAEERFKEGDTFTYKSNGDGYLGADEALVYLAFSTSDMHKATRVHNDIASKCPSQPGADKYGNALIEPVCYRTTFFANATSYWDPIVTGRNFYQGLKPDLQQNYRYLLEVAGRKGGYQQNVWMDSDVTQGFLGTLQYIESMYSRYDTNRDGFIDQNETQVAFPVVKRALEQYAQTQGTTLSDSLADLVLTYMLAKGEVPNAVCDEFGTDWDLALWATERELPGGGDFQADRLRLLQIFGALGSSPQSSCSTKAASSAPSPSSLPPGSPSGIPSALSGLSLPILAKYF